MTRPTSMPGPSVDTAASSSPSRQHSSSSPPRPPYSPITPVLGPARVAAPGTSIATASANHHIPSSAPGAVAAAAPSSISSSSAGNAGPAAAAPPRTYTHTQPPQQFMAPPAASAAPISLDDNPDAIAVRASISVLQVQRAQAIKDLQTLQQIKARAMAQPEEFVAALVEGRVRTRREDEEDEDDDDDDDVVEDTLTTTIETLRPDPTGTDISPPPSSPSPHKRKWPALPTAQNIARAPAINWAQYGVIGDSLDKLHADQVARPPEGTPVRLAADGQALLSSAAAAARGVPRESLAAAAAVAAAMPGMGAAAVTASSSSAGASASGQKGGKR